MKSEIIQKLIAHVTAECGAVDVEARFDDMLDELYSFDSVGGPFQYLTPSNVLKEMLPTDYRCGVADYTGTEENLVEIGNEYYDKADVDAARDEFTGNLDEQIADLEKEIETLEAEEDKDEEEIATKQRELADLQSDEREASKHTF